MRFNAETLKTQRKRRGNALEMGGVASPWGREKGKERAEKIAGPSCARMDKAKPYPTWLDRRGPVFMIFSKQRATCSQEKWELTISQAASDTRARISGLARSSRQWEAKCSGLSRCGYPEGD